MADRNEQLRAHLLTIADHVRDALALMDAGAAAPVSLDLPKGSRACQHLKRTKAMGGYWSCPDCGATGRES